MELKEPTKRTNAAKTCNEPSTDLSKLLWCYSQKCERRQTANSQGILETQESKGTRPVASRVSLSLGRPESVATRENNVWANNFVQIRIWDGHAVGLLTVIDEYTRECLAIRAGRGIRSSDVIETLAELMAARGVPEHIRSDNGPEFTARAAREWLGRVGAKTPYI